MNPEQLAEILRLHDMWRRGERGGVPADLRGADLREADLSGANLVAADLSGANIRVADLRVANLSRANLRQANLHAADLFKADLSWADLSWADITGADLSWADLSQADLTGADLTMADLTGANLGGAYIRDAIDGAICRMDFGEWSICIRASHTSIGCQQHPNEKWLAWSPDDVAHMHQDARDWWAMHGEAIKAAIRCVMAKAAVK